MQKALHFRRIFGALKSLFWCNQKHRGMPPYGYFTFLKSEPKSENLILHKENSNDTNCPDEQVLAKF